MADFSAIEGIARELSQIETLLAQRTELLADIRKVSERITDEQALKLTKESDLQRLEDRIEALVTGLGL